MALDVRGPVERVVAMAAARRATPAQRAALAETGEAMRAAAAKGDMALYMRCDKAFDETLAASAANPFATRALAPLQTMVRRAWYYFRREPDLGASAERHAAVASAVAAGDPEAAGDASDALIAHLRAGLKQALAEL
nr:FCD domain-containing protein [Alsobacter ponti]